MKTNSTRAALIGGAAGVTVLALAAIGLAGFKWETGRWPFAVSMGSAPMSAPAEATAPVSNQAAPLPSNQAAPPPSTQAAPPPMTRKVLYYRNPMGLADTSHEPKKDSMGMDYIAVYADEEGGGDDNASATTVKISADKIQRSGVRSEDVLLTKMSRSLRVPGIAKPDERTLRTISLRANGFIEKLYANEKGKHVKAGEPLFRVYSQEMVGAQVDYQIAARDRGGASLKGGERKLTNLDVPPYVLETLRKTGEPLLSIEWPSPVTGVIMEKSIVEGQMAKMGEELLRIADLTSIWVIADVPEQDLARVKVGSAAKVVFRALPGEDFNGKVTFVLHELEASTRSAKVRIEIKNPDHKIRHEMYADVSIETGGDGEARITVPSSAVIDSGNRQVVLIDKGEGRFEPRAVKLGMRGDGVIEIAEGLQAGEKIVVSANFLIDAESNLKAALAAFSSAPASSGQAPKEQGPSGEVRPQ